MEDPKRTNGQIVRRWRTEEIVKTNIFFLSGVRYRITL